MNDDDIEELFRKAAGNYPLNSNSANWDAIANGLDNSKVQLANKTTYNRSRKHLLLILLLIPFVWLCNKYAFDNSNKNASLQKKSKQIQSPSTTSDPVSSSAPNQKAAVDKTKMQEEAQPENVQKIAPLQNEDAKTHLTSVFQKTSIPVLNDNTINKKNTSDVYNKPDEKINKQETKEKNKIEENLSQENLPGIDTSITTQSQKTDSAIVDKEKPEAKKDDAKKKESIRIKQKRFLYAGLLAGPDATTVKFQKVDNTGFSAGLLLGYQFNNKLSVESGLYYEQKFYYSEGKYFKSSYNNANRKFTKVTGDCLMLEVPVNLKYNVSSNRSSAWFVTSGISSYFMKGEKYDYTYLSWGQEHQGFYNNKKAASYFASALNVSVGYTKAIKKVATLRIEPYFKFPLRGIGTGKLPITSSGIFIGLTRKIW